MEHRIVHVQHRTKAALGDRERETCLIHMFLCFSPYCQSKSFISAMLCLSDPVIAAHPVIHSA